MEESAQPEQLSDMPEDLAALETMPRDEIVLDAVRLADLGATEVYDLGEENLAAFFALQLTPETLGPADGEWMEAQTQVQTFFTPRKPRAVILGRGAGGALQAAAPMLEVTCIIDSHWQTFDCIRENEGAGARDSSAKHLIRKSVSRFWRRCSQRSC